MGEPRDPNTPSVLSLLCREGGSHSARGRGHTDDTTDRPRGPGREKEAAREASYLRLLLWDAGQLTHVQCPRTRACVPDRACSAPAGGQGPPGRTHLRQPRTRRRRGRGQQAAASWCAAAAAKTAPSPGCRAGAGGVCRDPARRGFIASPKAMRGGGSSPWRSRSSPGLNPPLPTAPPSPPPPAGARDPRPSASSLWSPVREEGSDLPRYQTRRGERPRFPTSITLAPVLRRVPRQVLEVALGRGG